MKHKAKIIIFSVVTIAVIAVAVWYFLDSSEKRSDLSADLRSDLAAPPRIYPETISEPEQKTLDLPQRFLFAGALFV